MIDKTAAASLTAKMTKPYEARSRNRTRSGVLECWHFNLTIGDVVQVFDFPNEKSAALGAVSVALGLRKRGYAIEVID